MGKAIGIDLGTTYSCMAYANEDGIIEIIKNNTGDRTTPSVVFIDRDDKPVVVGKIAKDKAKLSPDNFVERIKTQMGRDFTFHCEGVDYSPATVSSFILGKLKQDAEKALGEEITDAVITVPAYFGFSERAATKDAAKIAGLNLLQLINEPTAAACDYALYNKQAAYDRTIMVYDLGGGTFDITLMQLVYDEGKISDIKLLTSDGDHNLGGKLWDDRIIDYMIEKFLEEFPDFSEDDLRNDPETRLWLSLKSEELKRNLSSDDETETVFEFQSNKCAIELTRQKFEEITSDLLERTLDLTQHVLDVKNFTPDKISEIVLVGGSTYMPQISNRLEEAFGILLVQYEPDEAVARGSAYVAGNLMTIEEEEHAEGEEIGSEKPVTSGGGKLTTISGASPIGLDDIINKTYGIKVYDQNDQPIISNLLIKDTPISEAQAEGEYGTSVANQQELKIEIFESESRENEIEPDYAVGLAEYTISLVGATLPANAPIKVLFKLNDSGLLEIEVTDVRNNQTYPNIVKIANCHTEEEIEEIINTVGNRTLK